MTLITDKLHKGLCLFIVFCCLLGEQHTLHIIQLVKGSLNQAGEKRKELLNYTKY
jgi:hypothetical protein